MGRFAPSPSGYLHMGNLLASLLAWLDCRKLGGELIFRMEDLDPARSKAVYRDAMAEEMLSAVSAAMDGDMDAVRSSMEAAGQAGADAIRGYIDAGVPPPNAPLTISGGWIRNFSSGKPVCVAGKGFDKPLYNTGELYNDFDYEIKDR